MSLTQQVGDLKFGSTRAVAILRLNADEAEADAVGGIPARQPIHHCVEGDVGVFVLVAAENSSLGSHHADHLKGLTADPNLLSDGIP